MLTEAEINALHEEREEIERLTPEEWAVLEAEGEPVDVRIAPDAQMYVWRNGVLVPLTYQTVLYDTGWVRGSTLTA